MNKILKKITTFIIPMVIILTLFACTVNTEEQDIVEETSVMRATSRDMAIDAGFGNNATYKMLESPMVTEDSVSMYGIDAYYETDKKLIKTVDLRAETRTFNDTLKWLETHIEKYDGNIDNSYIDSGNMEAKDFRKSAYYTVRIPADKLDTFLNSIGNNLNIVSKNENINDVTDEYDDTEARIATLKIEEDKLNELMKKAKTVEDMIKVEGKLSEVRSELDRISRRLKRLEKDVKYSTVTITINEVKDLTESISKDDYSKENILKLTRKNLEDTKKFLKSMGVMIITHLPAIIVCLIGILIFLIIVAIFIAIKDIIKSNNKPVNEGEKEDEESFDDKNSELSDDLE